MATSTARITWEFVGKADDLADPDELIVDAQQCAGCLKLVGFVWNERMKEIHFRPVAFVESRGKETFLCDRCVEVLRRVGVEE